MCIIFGDAIASKTLGYVGETTRNTNVFIYQNNVKVVGDDDIPRVMMLHVPTTGKITLHDTSDYNLFVEELKTEYESRLPKTRGLSKSVPSSNDDLSFEIQQVGIYTCIIADSPSVINDAIKTLDESLQVEISDEMLKIYEETFPSWKIVLALFKNKKEQKSQPFLVEYESFIVDNSDNGNKTPLLFFPALDNDSGSGIHSGIPNLKCDIERDHYIISGFQTLQKHINSYKVNIYDTNDFKFSQNIPTWLMPKYVTGEKLNYVVENSDILIMSETKEVIDINNHFGLTIKEFS